jgi:hypothetical protein
VLGLALEDGATGPLFFLLHLGRGDLKKNQTTRKLGFNFFLSKNLFFNQFKRGFLNKIK